MGVSWVEKRHQNTDKHPECNHMWRYTDSNPQLRVCMDCYIVQVFMDEELDDHD